MKTIFKKVKNTRDFLEKRDTNTLYFNSIGIGNNL